MKNSIVGLSVVVTLLCGALLFKKDREVAAVRVRIAAAEKKQEALTAEAAAAAKRNKSLQTRLRESRVEAQTLATQELDRQAVNTKTGTREHKGVSEIFRDEMMREALKAEAREGTAKNVNALFRDGLAEQLHLNDDQSAALKQLLADRMSILWDRMLLPMTTGELDEAGMAQAGTAIKEAIGKNSAQIRSLLGDDGYSAYQWFEQTQPEREMVKKFVSLTSEAGQQPTPEQQNQLFALMAGERAGFRSQNDLGNPEKLDFEHWYDNFSDEKIQAYSQGLAQANERIVQREQGLLSPEQLAQLKEALARDALHGIIVSRSTKALMAGNAP
jgi:hypothetical protein